MLTHPLAFVGFAQARMLSPEGLCRAYDNDGIGYVRAEGGAVVILRRTDVAAQPRRPQLWHASSPPPSIPPAAPTAFRCRREKAQAHLLRSLYEGNGIDPNSLAFVEGHGTGTKVGDPAEIWSIGTVIGAARRAPIPIGSIKTNIGHTEPASGLIGLMKAMLALENNYFPASLHFETPNDSVDFDALNVHVAADPIELLARQAAAPCRRQLVRLRRHQRPRHHQRSAQSGPTARSPNASIGKTFIASAHTATALDTLAQGYRTTLKQATPERTPLADRCRWRQSPAYEASLSSSRPTTRRQSSRRSTRASAIASEREAVQAEAIHDQSKIAFVFSGNGSQWAGMAVDAYRRNTAFRDRFNVIHALFQVRTQISLIDLLFDPELDAKLRDTKIAQPLLFAIQAALADVLGAARRQA